MSVAQIDNLMEVFKTLKIEDHMETYGYKIQQASEQVSQIRDVLESQSFLNWIKY